MKKKIVKWIMVGIPLLLVAVVAFIVGSSYVEHKELEVAMLNIKS